MTDDERETISREFAEAVNMSASDLADWLETEESRSVGWHTDGEEEAVGHKSGRRIVEIKRLKPRDLDDDDYKHMQKVVGYIHRHLAQRPHGDVTQTRWRYSLMNWGYDPLTD